MKQSKINGFQGSAIIGKLRSSSTVATLYFAMLAFGTAFAAASTFEATPVENGAYDGTVKADGERQAVSDECFG